MATHYFNMPLGQYFLCIDRVGKQSGGRNIYADVTVREKRAPGVRDDFKPGPIVARELMQRTALHTVGFSFLAAAELLEPEATFETGRHYAKPPARSLLRVPAEAFDLFRTDPPSNKVDVARAFWRRRETIEARMHILQRCQRVLETCTDADARYLDQQLTSLETLGAAKREADIADVAPEPLTMRNMGDSEQQFIAEAEDACPLCGGSGHHADATQVLDQLRTSIEAAPERAEGWSRDKALQALREYMNTIATRGKNRNDLV